MNFANSEYIPAVIICGAVLIALHIFYAVWRRLAISSSLLKNTGKRNLVAGLYSLITVKEILILIALITACIVLLAPGWGEKLRERSNEGTDVLIALDVSRSMLARDVSPSRLERSRSAIKLIAESLNGGRIGLIVFAGDAFLQCPLTDDVGALMMFLDSAGPESVRLQGTDMGKMLAEAARVYQKKRLTSKLLLVFTDGEDHEGGGDAAAKQFRELGVSVYAVGVGRGGDLIPAENAEGGGFYRDGEGNLIRTKKNEELLRRLAEKTGGFYIDITDSLSGIGKIVDMVGDKEKTVSGSRLVKETVDRTWIFLLLLIILLASELFIPERRKKI